MLQKRPILNGMITFQNSQGNDARGTLMKASRTTVVMEVYNPYSIIQLSEVLQSLSIYRGERLAYTGRGVVSNLVNTGLMLIVSVTLIDPWFDLVELQDSAQSIEPEVNSFVDDWGKSRRLRPGYLVAISELRSFLSELSHWLDPVDIGFGTENVTSDQNSHYPEQFNEILKGVLPQLTELFHNFEKEAAKVTRYELDKHKAFAQHEMHPLVMSAPFINRVYNKPLGYAGDYEMMNMIQNNPAQGPNTYARILNYMFTEIPIAQSVVNRTNTLVKYLSDGASDSQQTGEQYKALSIGCGPAIELQRFIQSDPNAEGSDLSILDFNKETIDYAYTKLTTAVKRSGKKIQIHKKQQSIHSLLKKAAPRSNSIGSEEGFLDSAYSFIYCSGLFDYLSDRVCQRLLRLFYQLIKPGGMVFITNMHTMNEDRYAMEHISEWYLNYRDESQKKQFIPEIGEQRIYSDATGMNLCVEIKKPSNCLSDDVESDDRTRR